MGKKEEEPPKLFSQKVINLQIRTTVKKGEMFNKIFNRFNFIINVEVHVIKPQQ